MNRFVALAMTLSACSTPSVRSPDTVTAVTAEETSPPVVMDESARRLQEEYKSLALKNDCSQGKRDLEGDWRFVGESRTPNYTDNLSIRGTRFTERISGNPDGKYLTATLEGDIRCLFKNRVLIQVDKVSPEGAYSNHSGDFYPCDVLSDMTRDVDRMLLICYFDWDVRPAAGMEFEFERVTSQ